MKLFKKIFFVFTILLVSLFSITGCNKENENENEYVLEKSDIFISVDEGKTYSNQLYKVPTDNDVFIKIIIKISSNVDENVDFTLKFSPIDNIEYMKGMNYTSSKIDEIDGSTYIDFSILTNKEWTFVFKVNHKKAETHEMILSFNNDKLYQNKQFRVIEFLNKTE